MMRNALHFGLVCKIFAFSGVYDELDLQSYTPQLGGAIFGSGDAEEKFDNNGDGKSSPSVSPTPVLPKVYLLQTIFVASARA